MTRSRPEEIEFSADRTDDVVARMQTVAVSGSGWINLRPVVDPEDEPEPPGLFAIFGGSPHKVPLATWMPGRAREEADPPETTVGLQHAAGPRVARRLAEAGLPLPDGWRVTQDHPRRGLVAKVPPGDEAAVLAWMLRACRTVTAVPLTERWRVSVHTRLA